MSHPMRSTRMIGSGATMLLALNPTSGRSEMNKNVQCVRESKCLEEEQPPQGVFVGDHAGLVVNQFSLIFARQPIKVSLVAGRRSGRRGWWQSRDAAASLSLLRQVSLFRAASLSPPPSSRSTPQPALNQFYTNSQPYTCMPATAPRDSRSTYQH